MFYIIIMKKIMNFLIFLMILCFLYKSFNYLKKLIIVLSLNIKDLIAFAININI